jgi:hypothetical protein
LPQGTNLSTLLPALGAILLAIGALLLKLGWWPRRVGRTAHCRKCDYILVGSPQRCPECGTPVNARSIVHGERHRRSGLAWSGGVLAFLGLALLLLYTSGVARSIDWIRYKPLSWLLHDLRSGNASLDAPAWGEIQRRLDAGRLSEPDQARVTDVLLQVPATAFPTAAERSMSTFLAGRFLDHKLTAAQADAFFNGMLTTQLLVRPVVGSTNRVPYRIAGTGRGLDGWWMRMRMIEAHVDDGPAQYLGGAIGSNFQGGWTSGSTLPPVHAPGTHHVRVKIEIAADVDRGNGVNWNDNTPVARRMTRDLSANFQVIDGQAPIQTVAQPDASVLRPLLKVRFDPNLSDPRAWEMMVDAAALPVNVAFDIFVRINGHEHPAGTVTIPKGMPGGYGNSVRDVPPDWPAHADVIFRTSQAAARDTVDLTQIWQGEVVLPNVPLPRHNTRPPTAPAAATGP